MCLSGPVSSITAYGRQSTAELGQYLILDE